MFDVLYFVYTETKKNGVYIFMNFWGKQPPVSSKFQ